MYKLEPYPELFKVDFATNQIGTLPGLITPNWLGSTLFTVHAYYPEHPEVPPFSTFFTLNVSDKCIEPPMVDFMIKEMTYTIGQPVTT